MEDDAQPVLSTPKLDLDLLSVEELEARISSLTAEIEACKAAIARKGDAKSAADAMFSLGGKD